MTNQLSNDAKRVSQIVDEIDTYNTTISHLEYEICDVPHDASEIETFTYHQKLLQNKVNEITNDLEYSDDSVKIEYDGKLTQVYRDGLLWLECYSGQGGYDWIEHDPIEVRRNQRVAFLTAFAWDRMSNELLDEVMAFMKAHGFDAVK